MDLQPDEMTVTVRDRANESPWGSGPINPVTREVTISADCPTCGQRRGEPHGLNSCDDGAFYWVQTWNNPCGHLDTYEDVLAEARQRAVASASADEPKLRPIPIPGSPLADQAVGLPELEPEGDCPGCWCCDESTCTPGSPCRVMVDGATVEVAGDCPCKVGGQ